MKVMKRTVPLWALLLIIAVSASAVMAGIVATRQVNMTMKVIARNDIELYDIDGTTVLTNIALGNFYKGDAKTFPSNAPTGFYLVKNIGEGDVWVKWTKTGFPTGVNVKMMVDWGAGFQQVSEGTVVNQPLYAGSSNNSFKWYFEVTATETAQFGDFTPSVTWSAQDTAP